MISIPKQTLFLGTLGVIYGGGTHPFEDVVNRVADVVRCGRLDVHVTVEVVALEYCLAVVVEVVERVGLEKIVDEDVV